MFSVLFIVYYSIKQDNFKKMYKFPSRGESVEAYFNRANRHNWSHSLKFHSDKSSFPLTACP
jgi:uncharacterized FlgJ-related protein